MLVGGFDSMTRAPHAVRMRPAVKAGDQPLIDVMVHDGLYCSIADAGMGAMSDAENLRLGVSREAQDRFAAASHQRAAAAVDRLAEEIVPLAGLEHDEGIRPRTTYETLAKLPPAFGARRDDHRRQRQPGLRRGGRGADHDRRPRRRPAGRDRRPRRRRRARLDAAPAPRRGLAQAARAPRPQARRHRPVGDQRGLRRRHRGRRRGAGDRPRAGQRQRRRGRARPSAGRQRPAARSSRSPTSCAAAAAASASRRCAAAAGRARPSCCASSRFPAVDLLVIGAGPYGLATAAAARAAGLETVVVGRPMGFWRDHMPPGMFLRSGPDWHLDAHYEHTLERFLGDDVPDPLPLQRFLDYADWFQAAEGPRGPRGARDGTEARLRRHAGERRGAARARGRRRARASRTSPTAPRGPSTCRASTRCDLIDLSELEGRQRRDHRRPPERVRVGRAGRRARRGARRRHPPPRHARASSARTGPSWTRWSS